MEQTQTLYRCLREIWGRLSETEETLPAAQKERLWQDFILDLSCRLAGRVTEDPEEICRLAAGFPGMRGSDPAEHLRLLSESRRYRAYFDSCFHPGDGKPLGFYRVLSLADPDKTKASAREFTDCLKQYTETLLTDFCQKKGIAVPETEAADIGIRFLPPPDAAALLNPVPGKNIFNWYRECFGTEKGDGMIEDLYEALRRGEVKKEEPETILPGPFREKLTAGTLPMFCREDFAEGKTVNYMENGILYRENGPGTFSYCEGQIFLTDTELLWNGWENLRIPFSEIRKVILYDAMPDIVEIGRGGESYYFSVPEAALFYQALRLLDQKESAGKRPAETRPAEIFHVGRGMPSELSGLLSEAEKRISRLKEMSETWPDRKEEIDSFLSYYVPEAEEIVESYRRHLRNGSGEEAEKKVYEAVSLLVGALGRKQADVERMETMETIARAEALLEIMNEDGVAGEE